MCEIDGIGPVSLYSMFIKPCWNQTLDWNGYKNFLIPCTMEENHDRSRKKTFG